MRNRRQTWLFLIVIACVTLVAYFEPTHCVRGWLHGEAFFDGRPTSYWGDEIEPWECWAEVTSFSTLQQFYRRREHSIWPQAVRRCLPRKEATWPKLLDGDPDGLPVLQELLAHRSETVRDWAQEGIARLQNDQRGPSKWAGRGGI